MTGRRPLPNRRPCQRFTFRHDGFTYQAAVGLRPDTGEPAELFLSAGKVGSAIECVTRDAAVLASLALQSGVSVEVLRHALTRLDDGRPAGPVAKLLDLLAEESAP